MTVLTLPLLLLVAEQPRSGVLRQLPSYCAIETPVWCISEKAQTTISMKQEGDHRLWKIALADTLNTVVRLEESLGCSDVRPTGSLRRANLIEEHQRKNDVLVTTIVYTVPDYLCRLTISWHSPVSDMKAQRSHRYAVYGAITVGSPVKQNISLLANVRGLSRPSD